ncbi:DUF2975 domain-containing protein [Mesobacillus zeae]
MPSLAEYTGERYPEFAYLQSPVLIGLYFTVIPFIYGLFEAMKILG